MEKKWSDFSDSLSKPILSDKKGFLSDLIRLNNIRRLVMHPVRNESPDENAFDFVREFKRKLIFIN